MKHLGVQDKRIKVKIRMNYLVNGHDNSMLPLAVIFIPIPLPNAYGGR
jgi:hypothetical protein